MLKKLIILLMIMAPLGTFAQEKIAYINTQEVFMLMPELKGIETQLSAKQDEIKKTLATMQAEYDSKLKEFQSSTEQPSESVMMDRQKQIQDIQTRYETYLESSDKEFQDTRQRLLTPVQEKLQKAIEEVGAEQGYVYIIEKGALPYVSTKAIDASKFVKTKLGIQ